MSPAAIIPITFSAALVNGALGYGFSSMTVPLALLILSNRALNPALVPIEVVLNAHLLWVNRRALSAVTRRMLPVVIGLVPGVIAGTVVLARVTPSWLKLATYIALLPLILVQASGFRRPVRSERTAGGVFGFGLGALYSVTTISGPPLAIALKNQGYSAQEFRAALGLVRLAESTLTAIAYGAAGLFAGDSIALIPLMLPGIVVGVPIGAAMIARMQADTFRRVCISFDAWVVAFGISTLLRELRIVTGPAAFTVLAAVAAVDAVLLYRYVTMNAALAGKVRP